MILKYFVLNYLLNVQEIKAKKNKIQMTTKNSDRRQILALLVFVGCYFLLALVKYETRNNLVNKKNRLYGESNNSTDCKNRTIDEFPKDFLTLEQKKNGG